MAIMYLSIENFTCPKEQISVYLSVLYSFKNSMKSALSSLVNSMPDPDQLASLVNSIDPDQLASSEAS